MQDLASSTARASCLSPSLEPRARPSREPPSPDTIPPCQTTDDIERLILELHSTVQPGAPPAMGDSSRLERWLGAPGVAQRERPAAGGRRAAVDPRRQQGHPARRGAARRARHRRGGAPGARAARAAAVSRGAHRGCLVPHRRHRPLPHQPAPRAGPRRGGGPAAADPRAAAVDARPAADGRAAGAAAARPGARRRPHRIGQDDDARGASSRRSIAGTRGTS